MNGVRVLVATSRAALAEAAANRAALASQMAIMIANDVVWIIFWVLFVNRVGTLHGWDGDRVLLLLAVLTTAGGLCLGLLSNARRIGVLAVEGGFDAALGLPIEPLGHVLLRRVEPVNLGDVAFGVVLFGAVGHPTPVRTATYLVVSLGATALMAGFLVLTGSLAFFLGRSEGGELGFHAILLMGSYPIDVFAGVAKVLLYTVVPAAFVAAVPARLIEDGGAMLWLGFGSVCTLFALAGWATFTVGLRRYTSGAVWTRA